MATTRIQLRRGTEAQWTAANPTLAAGEIGIETDTNDFKFGDGATAWSSLDYALADTVDDYIPLSQKGVASGVATLDGSGKVPYNQIPSIDELSQDAVNTALVAGSGITKVYNDGANTITVSVDTSVIATKAELAEVSQDSINDALVAGTGLDKTYDDVNNLITIDIDSTVVTLTGSQTLTNKTLTSPVINTPTGIVKADVGLANVDNTSDANKPVSTATQTALDLKANLASPTFTGTVSGITSTMVGLGNVDNTSDANKPVSTATQTALDLKSTINSPTFTGTPSAPTANLGTNTTQIATTAFVRDTIEEVTGAAPAALDTLNELAAALGDDANFSSTVTNSLAAKAPLASPTFTGTVSGITATMVGLGNVNNTSDTNKPISTDTQTALDLKAPLFAPTFTGTVSLPDSTITTAMVADGAITSAKIADGTIVNNDINASAAIHWTKLGISSTVSETEIGYVDGVTSAIQTQIDSKADLASPTFTGTVSGITATMVGLGNVNNTSDANKPISTATQTALDLKAPLASPTFTGTVSLPDSTITTAMVADGAITSAKIADGTIVAGDLADGSVATAKIPDGAVTSAKITDSAITGDKLANDSVTTGKIAADTIVNADISPTAAISQSKINGLEDALNLKAPLADPTFTGTVSGITKSMVGLANVDNTADSAKPVSTAQASAIATAKAEAIADATSQVNAVIASAPAALDTLDELAAALGDDASFATTVTNSLAAKAPLASPTFTGTVTVAASGVAFTDGTQTKEGVPSRTEIVQSAGAYNLSTVGVSLRDELIEISHTGGSAVDVTIPTDATTNFPIGTSIDLLRTNSGKVRVVGAAGVTVNATPGAFLREQWSGATLLKRAANTWVLLGDLATS